MKYQKPVIVAVVQAIASIQNTHQKEGTNGDNFIQVTNPGYEADE
jgi:hypothetical protein